jgi:hypothetical protein
MFMIIAKTITPAAIRLMPRVERRIDAKRAKGVRAKNRRDPAERRRPNQNQLRPAKQERHEASPSFAQIHIQSTGVGIRRRQLGQRERAAQCEHTADDPDAQHQDRIRNARGNDGGRSEDS